MVGVCYRSPGSSVDEDRALFRMLGNVKDSKAVLVGDFISGWERRRQEKEDTQLFWSRLRQRECFKDIKWTELLDVTDIDQAWENFKRAIYQLKTDHIYYQSRRQYKASVNGALGKQQNVEEQKKRHGKSIEYGTQKSYSQYRHNLNAVNRANKTAQQNFEKKLAENIKNNSKSFYAYIRNKQRTMNKVGPLKDQNRELLVEDQKNAELLNEYFSSVFTQEDISNIPEPTNMFKGDSNEKLTELKVTPNEVLGKLENFKVDKSPGGDNIHPKLLYELRGAIAEPIAKLYNFSLTL